MKGTRARLRSLVRPRVSEARMDEEFRFHIEMETEKNLRAGVSPREARRRAMLAFGGVERHRERMRDGRGLAWLRDAGRDARYAVRSLARSPGFTLVAVLTISLGVGATAALFSVINALLLRPLPVSEPGRLFAVQEERTGAVSTGLEGHAIPYERFQAYREATGSVFSGLAAHRYRAFSVRSLGDAHHTSGVVVTAIGVYGVLAYQVAQRTREFGIRLALGASARDMVRLVVGRSAFLAAAGAAAGLLLAAATTRFLRTFLVGVSPLDPLTFAGVAAVLAAVALVASYLPARRAVRVDPMQALRAD